MTQTKLCKDCKQTLSHDKFYSDKRIKSGLRSICKKCAYKRQKLYIYAGGLTRKEYATRYVKQKLSTKDGRLAHNKRAREYNHKNKDNKKFVLTKLLRRIFRDFLIAHSEGKIYTSKRLDYNSKQLCEHLEKKFTKEMNWQNYGQYWEIDHLLPISIFEYTSYDDKQFKICWSLDNLQPLSREENRAKFNYIIKE